jgi:hypothetical protein
MPILRKDPEKEQQKSAEREERASRQIAAREEQERAKREAVFWASWEGQARAARMEGRTLFQVAIPLSQTQRTALGFFSGDTTTKTRKTSPLGVLESIEKEGWRLEHVGYVFEETGSVSRDKLLSSGQTSQITGMILGIYLFRATDSQAVSNIGGVTPIMEEP